MNGLDIYPDDIFEPTYEARINGDRAAFCVMRNMMEASINAERYRAWRIKYDAYPHDTADAVRRIDIPRVPLAKPQAVVEVISRPANVTSIKSAKKRGGANK